MALVVAGPINNIFAAAVTTIVAIGSMTDHLFFSAIKPPKPVFSLMYAPPTPKSFSPGYVAIMTSGRIVCIAKKMGNVACCNLENMGRGRTLNAITPPMKD